MLTSKLQQTRTSKFLDLGCGDGRLVHLAAQRNIESVGIDVDPILIKQCQIKAKELGVDRLCQFFIADMMEIDLNPFTHISCYLYQPTLSLVSVRLRERLLKGGCVLGTVLYKPLGWICNNCPEMLNDVYKIYLFDHTLKVIDNKGR